MIESQELQAMRERCDAAKRAVDTVEVHVDGGLFGEIPLSMAAQLFPAAVTSARDVPRLLEEMERLSPAEYWVGNEECMERECDYWFDGDGNEIPRGDQTRCPHIEVKVATLADVKRAEYLDELAQELRKAAQAHQRGEEWVAGRTLAELVLEGINDAYARIYCDENANPVVSAAAPVSAETAGSPREGEPGHGSGDA